MPWTRRRRALKFKGEANGLTAVADFISALQRSGWFPAADLGTSQSTKENLYTFEVTAMFKDPEVAAKEKEMKEKQAAVDAAAAAARAAKKGKK